MSNWKEYTISNIIIEQSKSKLQVQNANEHGRWPFFTSGERILKHTEYITEGDNIFLATGGVANVKYYSGKCAYSTDTYVLKCKDFDTNYFYYFLLEKRDFINNNLFSGSGLKHLQKKDFHKICFKAPQNPLEQRKIAQILATTDTLIEKTIAAIVKYKAIKQGMLHDLFTRGIEVKTGKLRPKQEDAPELYKQSELSWIPKDWETCNLGKYITQNLYGPRFNAKDYSERGNVKTIRGTDFTKDGEILYQQAPKAQLIPTLITAHKLEDGDVVIVTTADCGLTAVFKKPLNDVDFIPSAYSVKYRFADNVNPYFIKYFMATDYAIREVNKFVRQGTLGNLPGSDILKFDMVYPIKDEQNEIVARLLKIDKKIQAELSYLNKLQQLKSGLMSDLLSGNKLVCINNQLETEATN
jgi:type I restriction enzyme S subunit